MPCTSMHIKKHVKTCQNVSKHFYDVFLSDKQAIEAGAQHEIDNLCIGVLAAGF